ncbi:MAG TPA: GtrA family protein [Candidatus Acidoferrales bacterium]|jgi:putative flippase GtrA|nr:GtrA family protein [Candidatus Acidoferrales bacterium]
MVSYAVHNSYRSNGTMTRVFDWAKNKAQINTRMLKYGIVGCSGIAINLATMAIFLTVSFGSGWVPSAVASAVSTSCNFIFHNRWTFSDRQHQGLRLLRGFFSFAVISAMGIFITTEFYVTFVHVASHLPIVNSYLGKMGVPLSCQFVAILLGACMSYLLNGAFTWPRAESKSASEIVQVQES